jgi:hypothetical protein
MIEQPSELSRKYRVRRIPGGWRIEHAETCLGVFATPSEAVDRACRLARADADRGCLAIVTTETIPQEFHCYAPPQDQRTAGAAPLTPYLRLLVSN